MILLSDQRISHYCLTVSILAGDDKLTILTESRFGQIDGGHVVFVGVVVATLFDTLYGVHLIRVVGGVKLQQT